MITCANFRDLLKTILKDTDIGKFYCGKLDGKYEKSVCVYDRKSEAPKIAIGGKESTKTLSRSFSVLVHYTKNYKDTEESANNIYEIISEVANKSVEAKYNINFISMVNDYPIDLKSDDDGVYERLIDVTVYYNNK